MCRNPKDWLTIMAQCHALNYRTFPGRRKFVAASLTFVPSPAPNRYAIQTEFSRLVVGEFLRLMLAIRTWSWACTDFSFDALSTRPNAARSFLRSLVELCFSNIKLALDPPSHLVLDLAATK
jgi:hypothetical protein